MKQLIVYVKESYYKFPEMWIRHLYSISDLGHLTVYERSEVTGEETVVAVFREWSYLIIEE